MKFRTLVLGMAMLGTALSLSAQNGVLSERGTERLQNQVRHELNMIPYVSVFDYLTYSVDANGNVTLSGEVTNPVVQSDAVNAVKHIEGVEHVNNQIRVLPPSFMDDGLRVRLFRTIYGYPTMQKYALGVQKPIRIIVDGGRVTLLGAVDSQMDKNVAGIRANTVPGIFSVNNQLQVVKG